MKIGNGVKRGSNIFSKSALFVIFILSILILTLGVSAQLQITCMLKPEYNLGDSIPICGYVVAQQDMYTKFKVELLCTDFFRTFEYDLNLAAGQQKQFTDFLQQIPMARVKAPQDCAIDYSVIEPLSESVLYNAKSSIFTISNELDVGIHSLNVYFQLGNEVGISGYAYKKDGTEIDGKAYLFLDKGNEQIFIDETSVDSGSFTFQSTLKHLPSNTYKAIVKVYDLDGNIGQFKAREQIVIGDGLDYTITLNDDRLLPGDTLKVNLAVNGYAQSDTINVSDNSTQFNFYVSFNSQSDLVSFSGAEDDFEIQLDPDMPAGIYPLKIKGIDEFGNSNSFESDIIVSHQVRTISVEMVNDSFRPGDVLEAQIDLYDQTGELFDSDVNVKLLDEDDEPFFEKNHTSNNLLVLKLANDITPGEYTLRVERSGIVTETMWIMEATSDVELDNIGQTIIVRNKGNTRADRSVTVHITDPATSDSSTVDQSVSLGPGEQASIDLGNHVGKDGKYDVDVNMGMGIPGEQGAVKSFSDVDVARRSFFSKLGNTVTGNSISSRSIDSGMLTLFLIALILGGLFLFGIQFYSRTEPNGLQDAKHNFTDEDDGNANMYDAMVAQAACASLLDDGTGGVGAVKLAKPSELRKNKGVCLPGPLVKLDADSKLKRMDGSGRYIDPNAKYRINAGSTIGSSRVAGAFARPKRRVPKPAEDIKPKVPLKQIVKGILISLLEMPLNRLKGTQPEQKSGTSKGKSAENAGYAQNKKPGQSEHLSPAQKKIFDDEYFARKKNEH